MNAKFAFIRNENNQSTKKLHGVNTVMGIAHDNGADTLNASTILPIVFIFDFFIRHAFLLCHPFSIFHLFAEAATKDLP
ncbi:hypothetical protein [Dickeya sp. DW 0440]|nr:hypothetical protein [Dickeya sp. DW 0440]